MTWQIVQSLIYMGRDLSETCAECEFEYGVESELAGGARIYATKADAMKVAFCMSFKRPDLELAVKATAELDLLRQMAEGPRRDPAG